MSKFLSALEVELLSDATNAGRGTWQLLTPLVYASDIAAHVFTVPAGFKTDFASVPRVPVAFLLTADSAHEAAALHDFLYSTQCVPRALADAVLREAAIASGVPRWRAALMWAGVRIFGGAFWI